MEVTRIYTRNVIAAQRSSTLQEAALLMRRYHVGALLVSENETHAGGVVGIITDRDLVVQAMAEGIGPREITVGEVMTSNIAAIPEAADIHEAMGAMRKFGVRRLAVTAGDGAVVGILSFDDIIDALAVEMSSLAEVIRNERGREVEGFGKIVAAG